MQTGWIAAFREWLKNNQARLEHENIRVEIVGVTPYVPSSIHVNLFGERREATVQFWDDGQSDFHFLDWEAAERNPEVGVVVTHHDFATSGEMSTELEKLVTCLSLKSFTGITGFSYTVYNDADAVRHPSSSVASKGRGKR